MNTLGFAEPAPAPKVSMEEKTMGKVTLYFTSDFGMGVRKVEARSCKVAVKQYAQYERGVYLEFLKPRERRPRCLVQAYGANVVILDGWGHPDPDGMFLPEEPGQTEGVTVQRSRYSACDPRWESDFNAKLAAYLDEKEILPLYDFRGHQPGNRGCVSPLCSCPACESEYDASH